MLDYGRHPYRAPILLSIPLVVWAALAAGACAPEEFDTATSPGNGAAGRANVADAAGEQRLPEGVTQDELSPVEKQEIELLRTAIQSGLRLGKDALTDEVNLELGQNGSSARYTSTTQKTGVQYVAVATTKTPVCPFLETPKTGSSTSCQELLSRAFARAYSRITGLQEANPLDSKFDSVKVEASRWHGEGINTGIGNETTLAGYDMRKNSICDQAPAPGESAEQEGIEQGRLLYITKLNERFSKLGMAMHYPDSITEIRQCQLDASLLEPARSEALTALEDYAKGHELCTDYTPQTQEDINALAQAQKRFRTGIEKGISAESGLAAEEIFRVVPCNVGDPLVFDIDGDGVRLESLGSSHARFDLFDTGKPVATEWVWGDDAFLVLDRNRNGRIDSGRELFGNFVGDRGFDEVPTGFDHLRLYDANCDGTIDAADPVFDELRLWQDQNGNAEAEPGELHSLPELGVQSIGLQYGPPATRNRQIAHQAAFQLTQEAAAKRGSATGSVYDVWLRHGLARVW